MGSADYNQRRDQNLNCFFFKDFLKLTDIFKLRSIRVDGALKRNNKQPLKLSSLKFSSTK